MRDHHRLTRDVVPSHYDLHLVPDLDAGTFTGTESVTVEVAEATDELVLHALDLDIHEIWFEQDGRRLDGSVTFHADTETVAIALSGTAEPGAWVLHADFTGELNDKLVGFYRSTYVDDDGVTRTVACTQFESTHARRAFPCWDEPAFKATYAITLDVADDLLAISNGAEIESAGLPDGRRRVRFATTMSMSTYLVAFIVGPLEASEPIDVDGVPLRVIARPGLADQTRFALEVGAFSLRFLADWYDIAYPGDKLDLVAIPDFSFGAMENLGCVTFRETALLADRGRATTVELQRICDIVAHEIAHMWFGDLVTMGWWNGIWLNEAFATFMELLTTDAFEPAWQRWTDFGLSRSAAFDTDSLSTTRPIEFEVVTAADAEGMFDILTYEKGASVVRMLQQYLGEDAFQAGIRHYLRTHAYGNTETTDLWDAIEEATGEPVRTLMDSWIYRPGHPVVTLTRSGSAITLRQDRFSFAPDPAAGVEVPTEEPRVVPVVLRAGPPGTEPIRVLLDSAETTVELPDPDAAFIVGNLEGNGFYRVASSDADLAAVAAAAGSHLTPIERYGLVEDEWALYLSGRGSVPRIVGLFRGLAAETDTSVWQRIIGVLGALHRHGGDTARPDVEAWVRALVGPAAHALGPAAVPGEPERTGTLRAALFEARCRLGADAGERSRALQLFAQLAEPDHGIDPDLADAVVHVVAAGADAATWDTLRARALSAGTPQDRLRYQGALADTADVSLVLRFCELVLTPEIRTQDGLYLLRRALTNRHAAPDAWAFIEASWDAITERFPSASVPRLLEGVRSVGDRTLATAIAAFLDAHPVPQGDKVIRQHLERMWVTVALAERLPAELATGLP